LKKIFFAKIKNLLICCSFLYAEYITRLSNDQNDNRLEHRLSFDNVMEVWSWWNLWLSNFTSQMFC